MLIADNFHPLDFDAEEVLEYLREEMDQADHIIVDNNIVKPLVVFPFEYKRLAKIKKDDRLLLVHFAGLLDAGETSFDFEPYLERQLGYLRDLYDLFVEASPITSSQVYSELEGAINAFKSTGDHCLERGLFSEPFRENQLAALSFAFQVADQLEQFYDLLKAEEIPEERASTPDDSLVSLAMDYRQSGRTLLLSSDQQHIAKKLKRANEKGKRERRSFRYGVKQIGIRYHEKKAGVFFDSRHPNATYQ